MRAFQVRCFTQGFVIRRLKGRQESDVEQLKQYKDEGRALKEEVAALKAEVKSLE